MAIMYKDLNNVLIEQKSLENEFIETSGYGNWLIFNDLSAFAGDI